MERLVRVSVYPNEASPYAFASMLLRADQEWIGKQLVRIQYYLNHKERLDDNLAYFEYWGGYFPFFDTYDLGEEGEEISERMEDGDYIFEISEEMVKKIEALKHPIRTDTNRIVVANDGIFITAWGKHNDLKYDSEIITTQDLKEMLSVLNEGMSKRKE